PANVRARLVFVSEHNDRRVPGRDINAIKSRSARKVTFSETSVTPNRSTPPNSPRSSSSSFPTSKIHTRTTESPQIHHVFCAEKSTIPARHHPKCLSKTKRHPTQA